VQLDVVRDHETPGVDADEPAAEHIVTEQDLSLATLEVGEIEIFSRELNSAGLHLGDPVARNEELPPGDASHEPGHRRVAALCESGDDVVDAAEPAPCSIDERAAEDPGECQPDPFGGWLPGV
jgi:hypothetical protein